MADDYVVTCETDPLDADPADRTWRCPECREGVLRPADLVSPRYIGKVLGCSKCRYRERL